LFIIVVIFIVFAIAAVFVVTFDTASTAFVTAVNVWRRHDTALVPKVVVVHEYHNNDQQEQCYEKKAYIDARCHFVSRKIF
jgi:hypothetical protein